MNTKIAYRIKSPHTNSTTIAQAIAVTEKLGGSAATESILLLHGYAGSPMHWDQVAERLSKKYNVILPNLSHLYLTNEEIPFGFQVDILARFIKLNFPDQVLHVAGISFGAALAWGLCLKYPNLIKKVVFINPMPPGPVDCFRWSGMQNYFRFPVSKKGLYYFLKTPVGRYFLNKAAEMFRVERADFWHKIDDIKGQKLTFVCHVLYKFHWILKNENWDYWIKTFSRWQHNSLILVDHQDPLFTKEAYEKFAYEVSPYSVIEIKNAGHMAIHYKGAEVADHIDHFLMNWDNSRRSTG